MSRDGEYFLFRFLERFARYMERRNLTKKIRAQDRLEDLRQEEYFYNPREEQEVGLRIAIYSIKESKWHEKARNYAKKRRAYERGIMQELGDCVSFSEAEKFEKAGHIQDFEIDTILNSFSEIDADNSEN